MSRTLLLAAFFGTVSLLTALADDPGPRDPKTYDKLVIDTLRDVHNLGANLYNTARDYAGTFRMYEGALRTIRPLLSHRPDAQKLIDEGLEAVQREADFARRAFLLHETIEKVRAFLKAGLVAGGTSPKPPEPMPKTPAPEPTPKSVEPKPKDKPAEPMPKTPGPEPTPKSVEPKPKDTPKGKSSKKSDANPSGQANSSSVGGAGNGSSSSGSAEGQSPQPSATVPKTPSEPRVTRGRVIVPAGLTHPLEVVLVSLDRAEPRVFVAQTGMDGTFSIPILVPDGKFIVIVRGPGVPEKYATTTTSGLVTEVVRGVVRDVRLPG